MEHVIELKKGIDNLTFGCTIDEVKKVLGEASAIETIDNEPETPTIVLHYDEHGMSLFFEGETNPTLACIDIDGENAILFGKSLEEYSEQAVVQLMVANKYYSEDIENESWGERRISFPEANIDFFFEDNSLTTITFGK
jgi:hypothetical protein